MSQVPQPAAPAVLTPAWVSQPRPGASVPARVIGAVGIVVAAMAAVLAFAYLGLAFGVAGAVIDFLVALVPLAAVLLVVRWVDRWEPEPFGARVFAFLWGAGVSIVIALLVDLGVQLYDRAAHIRPDELVGAVVQAPLVEEGAKGLGVLLIFLVMRRTFDGPVDGIVYGATVAAGFAFVENIQYFAVALAEQGGQGLAVTFFLRALMLPFGHLIFTSCTGAALGIATRLRSRAAGVLLFFAGLSTAMVLHAAFNSAGAFTGGLPGFLAVYVCVEVPLFAGIVVLVVLVRRQEQRTTRAALAAYQAAGWFTPAEVEMLGTARGRTQARRWARGFGLAAPMRALIADATRLAQTRQRIVVGHRVAQAQQDERMLLAAVVADREALIGRGR